MQRTKYSKVVLKKPSLILIMGTPGSGKTTLAKALLSKMAAVYLDNNFTADAFSTISRTNPHYKRVRKKLYDILYRITQENLRVGNSVLLDIPHVTHMQDKKWQFFIKSLVRNQFPLIIIRCYCSESTLKRRLSERGEKRDTWKLKNWTKFLKKEPLRVPISFSHYEIDTELNTKKNIALALKYIVKSSSKAT